MSPHSPSRQTRSAHARSIRDCNDVAGARASLDQEIRQASGSPGVAYESSARRAGSALHAGSARVQTLRQKDSGDRLPGEFPVRCGGGKILRVGRGVLRQVMRLVGRKNRLHMGRPVAGPTVVATEKRVTGGKATPHTA